MINRKSVNKQLRGKKLPKETVSIIVHNITELVGIIVHNIPKDYKPSDKPLEDLKKIIIHD